jgi:hypothetical protein
MAKILALVPSSGLDALLTAIELILAQMPQLGRVSVEHVENVLARLRDAQPLSRIGVIGPFHDRRNRATG